MRLIPVSGDVMGPSHGSMIRALPVAQGPERLGGVTGLRVLNELVWQRFFPT